MVSDLLNRLNGLAQPSKINDDLAARITSEAEVRIFSEGDHILKKGQICVGAFFLVKGLARSYYIKDNKQITSRLMEEGFIITSWLSFYSQQPSNEYIIAMEDCETVYLDFNTINDLYVEFPVFNVIGRRQVEYSFCQAEIRTQMLRGLTAEQRYSLFCENNPSLLRRVPLKYIASYLGMSDETLSRIRAGYRKRQKIS